MSEVKVSGASDDIINIDGAISEEFSCWGGDDPEPRFLAFSDGTLLSIQYGVGGGLWRINRLSAGTAEYEKVEATDEDENYSDVVTLRGDLRWVVMGEHHAKART